MSKQRPGRLVAALVGAALVGASVMAPTGVAEAASAPASRASTDHVHQWWYDAMRLADAQRVSTGKGVVVAVLDRYVDPTVPDLKGADIDVRGNCLNRPVPKVSGMVSDHGTAMVTAIVGQGTGNGPGGRGVLGVAPDATVRFYSTDTDPTNDFGECDSVLIGPMIVKAARQGADIISASFGMNGSHALNTKYVRQAQSYGAVVVAASGEKSAGHTIMDEPAAIAGVVAVNAADHRGYSWGLNPDPTDLDGELNYPTITAPGMDIQLGGYVAGRGWVSGAARTGTSGATAITAGALALAKSRWPTATNNQLIQSLIHWPGNAHQGNLSFEDRFGYGVLAVNSLVKVDPTKYPDVNPLLNGPQRAIKDFPASVYGASASTTAGQGAPSSSGATATPAPTTRAQTSNAGGQQASSEGGGTPGWVWPLGAVAVLAGLGGLVLAARRRRTGAPEPDRPAPEAVPSSSGSHHRTEGE